MTLRFACLVTLLACSCSGDDAASSGDAQSSTTQAADETAGDTTDAAGDTTVAEGGTTVADGGTTVAEDGTTVADGGTTDAEGGTTDGMTGSCAVPTSYEGCEGVMPPSADVPEFARAIIVGESESLLTFANVQVPELLCGADLSAKELPGCQCDNWQETSRFTITGALDVGLIDPTQITLWSAGGGCGEEGYAIFDEVVVGFEVTALTDTCVAGQVMIEDGLGGLPTEFGFVAPRC